MKFTLLFLFIILGMSTYSYAKPHVFLGYHKYLKDVQDGNGKVQKKPYDPVLGFGYNFKLTDTFGFSPQIGYIHNKVVAEDSYGEQKVHTLFINYDFLWVMPFWDSMALRFGIGNFIKRISGKGGDVTIPNGTGTTTASRPSKTVNSFSGTFNIGTDITYSLDNNDWWITDVGFRFETYIYRPLSSKYRNYAYNVGLLLYF